MARDVQRRALMRALKLPTGESIPVLGQGTWHMAEVASRRRDEIAALRLGLDLGLSLVDTAEMYADGATEELVGEAIDGRRDEVFLVSKVMPNHTSRRGTIAACERSLRRLGTDRLDLYLYHWRGGSTPLAETLEAFDELVGAGKIRAWGVSNFDVDDMEELLALDGGAACQTDQVLYNLTRRGIEHDLVPLLSSLHIPIMAYSPVEQGRLLAHSAVKAVAREHGATPAQVALAWVLRHPGVMAIPKMGTTEHVRENAAALELELTPRDVTALDRAFPPPAGKVPLEML